MAASKKRWYSVAVDFVHGLEIFRHPLLPEESVRLWDYMEKRRLNGDIGKFAIVRDDNVNPLPDEAIGVACTYAIQKQIAMLLPKGEKSE